MEAHLSDLTYHLGRVEEEQAIFSQTEKHLRILFFMKSFYIKCRKVAFEKFKFTTEFSNDMNKLSSLNI